MTEIPGNTLLSLGAAASWGGGDFSGGMAAKAAGSSIRGVLRVIVVSHTTSLTLLLVLLALRGAPIPHGAPLYWELCCGVIAVLSLLMFYIALARGAMGVSAAVSGLLAAAIPALVSTFLEGAPGVMRLAGFVLALISIWVIAAGESPENAHGQRGILWLAIASGLGFGFYFVSLRMGNSLGILEPIALARGASLLTCCLLLLAMELRHKTHSRVPFLAGRWLPWRSAAWAMGIASLDTGGNILFIAATRTGRLDVAAVLASLYPAVTILLAAWRLQERLTRRQLWGMGIALVAVLMITL